MDMARRRADKGQYPTEMPPTARRGTANCYSAKTQPFWQSARDGENNCPDCKENVKKEEEDLLFVGFFNVQATR